MGRLTRVPTMRDQSSPRLLQIGEVADRAGLSLRTVRYYEEMGLIVPEKRTDGGFRLYTDDHVARLELIKEMKPLRFSVLEMNELLGARDALTADPHDDAAREQLSLYAKETAARCDALRQKLDRGERLAEQLRRESRKPRKRQRVTAEH